ncbi:MAG: M61 family metallopeptidase [Betaproteobacteria bacterium]|nr:M61 family metallopeptidase [Betaproteobacteria bacterium]
MLAIHHRIRPLDPRAHVFEVCCTVDAPDPAGQRFRLPAWIPGSYLIREFSRQFVAVRAEAAGRPVAIRKEAKDRWRADPTQAPLTVIATVHAFDVSVRTAYLDATRGYFNGACVFLCPEGFEAAPCTVDILPPEGPEFAHWRVATTLPSGGAPPQGFGRYRAADYDELIDHPVELGEFMLASFAAGAVPHQVALTGRHDADVERMTRDLGRVCQWHNDLFGGRPASRAPFDRYLFLVTVLGSGHGGLEHRTSASLLCSRSELPRRGHTEVSDDYLTFLGLASHEYFHAWNVKRIKPAAFTPYDLARENYTRQLWAFEGITSYYDDLALLKSGVIDPPRYLELLGRAISTVLRTPGRRVQSVGDSSFDAWIKFYRQDENSPNAVVSYYAKGSLVALALDLTLRSGGRASLDDVMRALWNRHGRTGTGVTENGLQSIAEELAGVGLGDFFGRYVDGTDDLPLAALLDAFGIDLHLRPADGTKDRGGKPASGPLPACWLGASANGDMQLRHVFSGGPAERAGLAPQDTLVALDGLKASAAALEALLATRAPGDRVEVHAFRRDELFAVEVELETAPADTCHLTLRAEVSAQTAALRGAWLGSS